MTTYVCLSCQRIVERDEGDPLPTGDERCSHEFEIVPTFRSVPCDACGGSGYYDCPYCGMTDFCSCGTGGVRCYVCGGSGSIQIKEKE